MNILMLCLCPLQLSNRSEKYRTVDISNTFYFRKYCLRIKNCGKNTVEYKIIDCQIQQNSENLEHDYNFCA